MCDCTGNQWLTFFQESGEAILNNTAEHIGRLLDTVSGAEELKLSLYRPSQNIQ